MSLPRASLALGIATVSLVALTGCIFDDPDNHDSAAPTPTETTAEVEPTPTADAVAVSSIVIDGDSVYVTATEGGILVDIPFTTEPAVAASQLSEAIGMEPITTVSPENLCDPALTRTTWGAITFVSPYPSAPPGAKFYAIADSKQTGNGITVAMLGGQWIGYDGSDTVAAYPGAELDTGFPATSVLAYDVASGTADGDPDDFYGGLAVVQNDVLTSFSSPIHYWYDC
jgi:hypothetical protein